MNTIKILVLLVMALTSGCNKDKTNDSSEVKPGNDPNFTIVKNSDKGFEAFNKKVEVFGIPIYAVNKVDDVKLLHAANVMAQYLDNDEDGAVDNKSVIDIMKSNKAFMVMWKSQGDIEKVSAESRYGQDLGNDETNPEWHKNKTGRFDAALEEVLHIITHAGFSNVYPEILGENDKSLVGKSMNIARGGNFKSIPDKYPASAWYTYDDNTCEYNCMVTEYIYWALTSHLGAQVNRENEISNEWKLHTPELLKQRDFNVYRILTNKDYKLPSKLPDGKYRQ